MAPPPPPSRDVPDKGKEVIICKRRAIVLKNLNSQSWTANNLHYENTTFQICQTMMFSIILFVSKRFCSCWVCLQTESTLGIDFERATTIAMRRGNFCLQVSRTPTGRWDTVWPLTSIYQAPDQAKGYLTWNVKYKAITRDNVHLPFPSDIGRDFAPYRSLFCTKVTQILSNPRNCWSKQTEILVCSS